MKSTTEIIHILKRFKQESAHKYGIKSLGIWGSFARKQQDEASDLILTGINKVCATHY